MAVTTLLVTQLVGQAWIRNPDGTLTPLRPGMSVPVDANIVTADGSMVVLEADGYPPIVIGGGRDVVLSADMFATDVDVTTVAVEGLENSDVQRVLDALNSGSDPFSSLDSTAAVLESSGRLTSNAGFVRLAPVIEITSPLGVEYPRSTPTFEFFNVSGVEESSRTFGQAMAALEISADAATSADTPTAP
ncbi:MAG TPA: retention module-containing protein, partial [Pusillimonas sp.]|uniref:retention module-containing protein n=1 Tax=Pusillimonas sp. TaxID=3040095 RepID=UPI002B4ADE44